jgi:hypothetical protein
MIAPAPCRSVRVGGSANRVSSSATQIAKVTLAVVAAISVVLLRPLPARAFDACTGKIVCLHLYVGASEFDGGYPDGLITSDPPGIHCQLVDNKAAAGSTCDAYFTSSVRTSFDVVLNATASPGHAVFVGCEQHGVPVQSCTRTSVADCICHKIVVITFADTVSTSTGPPNETAVPAAASGEASIAPSPDSRAPTAAPTDVLLIVLAILATGLVIGAGLVFVGIQMRRSRGG